MGKAMRSGWIVAAMLVFAPCLAAAAPSVPVGERERFEAERAEHAAELDLKRADLELRDKQADADSWKNPLVLAIIAAAIAALGNAAIAWQNGRQQRALESSRAEDNLALEREKAKVERQLAAQRSESDRILEVIRTGGDSDAAAKNMQFLVEAGLVTQPALVRKLTSFLATRQPGAGPSLPTRDGSFAFQRSEHLTEGVEQTITANLNDFVDYLSHIGFTPEGQVNIVVEDNLQNAYYDSEKNQVVLGLEFRDDPEVARREYMHHQLVSISATRDAFTYICIESGLADYFPCSYSGKPTLGEISGKSLGYGGAIRSLTGRKGYAALAGVTDPMFEGGQLWGSLFWRLRGALGQAAADRMLFAAWSAMGKWPADRHTAAERFGDAILHAASDGNARTAVKRVLDTRGFPHG